MNGPRRVDRSLRSERLSWIGGRYGSTANIFGTSKKLHGPIVHITVTQVSNRTGGYDTAGQRRKVYRDGKQADRGSRKPTEKGAVGIILDVSRVRSEFAGHALLERLRGDRDSRLTWRRLWSRCAKTIVSSMSGPCNSPLAMGKGLR
jgi:hypothetical protein